MPRQTPNLVLLAGPNGAGKTTVSRTVLADELGIVEFVNADALAVGLSGFDPQRAAFAAGRIMLQRLHELARAGVDFAFETTLASRTFAPFIRRLRSDGYRCHLIYVWLDSPKRCIERIRTRVREGGHHVSDDTVNRRYARSLVNFFSLYLPLVDSWVAYNNTQSAGPRVIAERPCNEPVRIVRLADWRSMKEIAHESRF